MSESEKKISQEQQRFLDRFFTATVTIYGIVDLPIAWDIYMSMKQHKNPELVRMHRSDMLAYADAEMDQEHFWNIIEVNKLYPDREPNDLNRILIHPSLKELNDPNFEKSHAVLEARKGMNVSIPEDFFSYADYPRNPEQKAFITFVDRLRVRAMTIVDSLDPTRRIETEHRGAKMGELTNDTVEGRNWADTVEVGITGDDDIPSAPVDVLLILLDHLIRSGDMTLDEAYSYLIHSLEKMGAVFSKKELYKLNVLFNDYAEWTAQWKYWGAAEVDLDDPMDSF